MKASVLSVVAALAVCGTANLATAGEVTLIPSADATLYENSFGDTAGGSGEFLFIGKNNSNLIYRTLLRFDLDGAVPTGATVESATLTMFCSRTLAGDEIATAHRVLADWGEGSSVPDGNGGAGVLAQEDDATWLYTFFVPPFGAGSPTWNTPGGDFEPTASASSIIGGEFQFYSWSSPGLAADVQSWVDGSNDNFGWLLRGREDGSGRTSKRFDSKDGVTPSLRPMLTIVFSEGNQCLPDLAEPFGVLDLSDVQAFVNGFFAGDPIADVAEPAGVLDLADVQGFIAAFIAGCP